MATKGGSPCPFRSGLIPTRLGGAPQQGRRRTRPRLAACWPWPAIYDGASRSEAARTGGVTLRIAQDWVLRFDAESLAGLVDRKAPGQAPRLNDSHRAALATVL
jgi:hypothetical protein